MPCQTHWSAEVLAFTLSPVGWSSYLLTLWSTLGTMKTHLSFLRNIPAFLESVTPFPECVGALLLYVLLSGCRQYRPLHVQGLVGGCPLFFEKWMAGCNPEWHTSVFKKALVDIDSEVLQLQLVNDTPPDIAVNS